MIFNRENNSVSLKKYYTILIEFGLILSLLLFILAAKINFAPAKKAPDFKKTGEITEIKSIQSTIIDKKPKPPRPRVPVEVPTDEVIEEQIVNLDAELNFNEPLELPASPDQKDEKEEDFFIVVEEMPELIDGLAALQKRIRYPEKARRAGIEGRVTVQFIVDRDGSVEDPRIIRGIGGGCDEEALRAVKNSRFKPGLQRGEPVRVQYSLPVLFILK